MPEKGAGWKSGPCEILWQIECRTQAIVELFQQCVGQLAKYRFNSVGVHARKPQARHDRVMKKAFPSGVEMSMRR